MLPVPTFLQDKRVQTIHRTPQTCSRAISETVALFSFLETERHIGAWDLTRIPICRSHLEKGHLLNRESLGFRKPTIYRYESAHVPFLGNLYLRHSLALSHEALHIYFHFSHKNCFSKCRHSARVNFRPLSLFSYLLRSVTRRRFICALKFGILSNYWRASLGNWKAHSRSAPLHLPYEDHLIDIIDSNSHLK